MNIDELIEVYKSSPGKVIHYGPELHVIEAANRLADELAKLRANPPLTFPEKIALAWAERMGKSGGLYGPLLMGILVRLKNKAAETRKKTLQEVAIIAGDAWNDNYYLVNQKDQAHRMRDLFNKMAEDAQ